MLSKDLSVKTSKNASFSGTIIFLYLRPGFCWLVLVGPSKTGIIIMETKVEAKGSPVHLTPDKRTQDFLESESKAPMKVVTHPSGAVQKVKKKGLNQFQPSSPTDRMLSPCSRKLMRKKSLPEETDAMIEAWAPPHNLDIILASSSKSRASILEELGWKFTTMSPNIDERKIQDDEETENIRLPAVIAKAKASAIFERLKKQSSGVDAKPSESSIIITSDQIVLFQGRIRGKPRDKEEAREFLMSYSEGEMCQTVTAVVATEFPSGRQSWEVDICTVHWTGIPSNAVDTLLQKEDVYYSCGGFLIEDDDFVKYVDKIEGSLDSIRGLPIKATKRAIYTVLSGSNKTKKSISRK